MRAVGLSGDTIAQNGGFAQCTNFNTGDLDIAYAPEFNATVWVAINNSTARAMLGWARVTDVGTKTLTAYNTPGKNLGPGNTGNTHPHIVHDSDTGNLIVTCVMGGTEGGIYFVRYGDYSGTPGDDDAIEITRERERFEYADDVSNMGIVYVPQHKSLIVGYKAIVGGSAVSYSQSYGKVVNLLRKTESSVIDVQDNSVGNSYSLPKIVYDVSTDRLLVAYQDTTQGSVAYRVGQIVGNTVNLGTKADLSSYTGDVQNIALTYDSNVNKILFLYSSQSDSKGYAF